MRVKAAVAQWETVVNQTIVASHAAMMEGMCQYFTERGRQLNDLVPSTQTV